mmetsp:Transcript_5806/g.21974  ORF Transcript_5806/g.21974 Transcript_5806/m.21974 type:complete len:308 (-) Transcript_5806:1329-2252(-)
MRGPTRVSLRAVLGEKPVRGGTGVGLWVWRDFCFGKNRKFARRGPVRRRGFRGSLRPITIRPRVWRVRRVQSLPPRPSRTGEHAVRPVPRFVLPRVGDLQAVVRRGVHEIGRARGVEPLLLVPVVPVLLPAAPAAAAEVSAVAGPELAAAAAYSRSTAAAHSGRHVRRPRTRRPDLRRYTVRGHRDLHPRRYAVLLRRGVRWVRRLLRRPRRVLLTCRGQCEKRAVPDKRGGPRSRRVPGVARGGRTPRPAARERERGRGRRESNRGTKCVHPRPCSWSYSAAANSANGPGGGKGSARVPNSIERSW